MMIEAFREKMTATGVKEWEGMDVQLYCGNKQRTVIPDGKEVWPGEGAYGVLGV